MKGCWERRGVHSAPVRALCHFGDHDGFLKSLCLTLMCHKPSCSPYKIKITFILTVWEVTPDLAAHPNSITAVRPAKESFALAQFTDK